MSTDQDPPRPRRVAAQAAQDGSTVVDPAPLDPFGSAWGSRRIRVMLVRVSPDAKARVEAVLPRRRNIRPEKLPFVVRITADPEVARETARRLRDAGGVAVVVEEPGSPDASAFCTRHTSRLAVAWCIRCGAPTCISCKTEARGEEICPRCVREGRSPRRRIRLRQLFVVFLFTVFLYQVVQYARTDEARVDPAGPVEVAILQFAEPDALAAPIVRRLNARGPEAGDGPTFADIQRWFNAERQRYGGPSDYLRVHVRGPWAQTVRPPDIDAAGSVLEAAWVAWRYKRYFVDLAADLGVDTSDYAARAFVVYGPQAGDVAAESRASERGRVAVSWIATDEENLAYAVLTVAHEIAHTLGARDTYDPDSFLSEFPYGFVEPFAEPPFPQRYAELMAGDLPLSPNAEAEIRSLDQVRVGYRSAADMGWVPVEEADLFYTPPTLRPGDLLPPRPDPGAAEGDGAMQ